MKVRQHVPVVDLFAGPGGLSHGFSTFEGGNVSFRVKLSIEKDPVAHRTLTLRAFLRQFPELPPEYYSFLRGENGVTFDRLRDRYPKEWEVATREARKWTLGKDPFPVVSQEIRAAIGSVRQWVLLGGPPCQAYSLAGRSRMKNEAGFATDEKHTLYREYLKIVAVHQPAIFVMENVKGVLSSQHAKRAREGSIFFRILDDLRNPAKAVQDDIEVRKLLPANPRTYRIYSFAVRRESPELLEPRDFIVRSEEWGIPQARHRVIILGVRDDMCGHPGILDDHAERGRNRIEDVLDGLPEIRSTISRGADSPVAWLKVIRSVTQGRYSKAITVRTLRASMRAHALKAAVIGGTGDRFLPGQFAPRRLSHWLFDPKLKGVIQHESRGHMESDLRRYFFASCAALVFGESIPISKFPSCLLPSHKSARSRGKSANGRRGKPDFNDRFRVQVRGRPSTTVMSHISKDGHYYIHYDPRQCRSLTVREAARLQTFPDTYFFEGGRTHQYHQVGNAVPPLLATKLAAVVAGFLSSMAAAEIPKSKVSVADVHG
jgi:DNA (cytosine-5)-methyltransferase 1